MKAEFSDYFTSIGMPGPFIRRLEALFEQITFLCPEEIDFVFINDYIQEDGVREYDSALFFSKRYVLEAKQFSTESSVDIAIYGDNITYLQIEAEAYNYPSDEPTEKSRLNCIVRLGADSSDLGFELKASKENCRHLVVIIESVIQPNLQ